MLGIVVLCIAFQRCIKLYLVLGFKGGEFRKVAAHLLQDRFKLRVCLEIGGDMTGVFDQPVKPVDRIVQILLLFQDSIQSLRCDLKDLSQVLSAVPRFLDDF